MLAGDDPVGPGRAGVDPPGRIDGDGVGPRLATARQGVLPDSPAQGGVDWYQLAGPVDGATIAIIGTLIPSGVGAVIICIMMPKMTPEMRPASAPASALLRMGAP